VVLHPTRNKKFFFGDVTTSMHATDSASEPVCEAACKSLCIVLELSCPYFRSCNHMLGALGPAVG